MTSNPLLPFIMSLGHESFRKDVNRLIQTIQVPPPYDSLIEDIYKRRGNLDSQQLIKIASLYLPEVEITVLKQLGDVDATLGLQYCEEVIRERALNEIEYIIQSEPDSRMALEYIKQKASDTIIGTHESIAKTIDQLDQSEEEYIFKFLRYPFAKKKMYMFFAYSGVGKTTMSLICAKVASKYNQKVLYIPIKDWTEASLYHQLAKCDHPLDIHYAVYAEATMSQIESEIAKVKPDVVIVDSLKGITNYSRHEQDHIEYGNRADTLRMLANEYDTCMISTHQLVVKEEIVLESHIQGSKSHLLEHLDLGLGIAPRTGSPRERIISTVKLRGMSAEDTFRVSLDYKKLECEDLGNYTPQPQQQYNNNPRSGRLR